MTPPDCATSKRTSDPTRIPDYGFKVRLDHEYPEKWSQRIKPTFREMIKSIPLAWRYTAYFRQAVAKGRQPIMDFYRCQNSKQMYGAPIGGLGGGTIGRGFRGEFCRFALVPGIYQYEIADADRFILTIRDSDGKTLHQQVLTHSTIGKRKNLTSWDWNFEGKDAEYTALYPRSWTEYNIGKYGLKLVCRQISPVIPSNYKDSSLPCAVFVWEIENLSERELNVSVTFTFQSGQGENPEGDKWTEAFRKDEATPGVMIHQKFRDMPCTYAVASRATKNTSVSRLLSFDPAGDGRELWSLLERTGKLNEETQTCSEKTTKPIGCAVCASTLVKPGDKGHLEFSLVWDMPKIHFYSKKREYLRYYTRYFYEPENSVAPEISKYSLDNYSSWEIDISDWQSEVLEDPELPDWYKSALFNELYYVADGGTVWLRSAETDNFPSTDPRLDYGRFAYLEGHEYRMYNTYDVHFYAAFAVSILWPNLQASLQYEIRDSVHRADEEVRTTLYGGIKTWRKKAGFVPHDIGDPCDEPFNLVNSYNVHDVSDWKDLNPKFVLSCYRDYVISGRIQTLRDFWATIKEVMERSMKWDKDDDGLIENSGFPDQTYDTWLPEGPSAYCGSLWLAALRCTAKIAEILGDADQAKRYTEILARASQAFQKKLWNGEYYNFDSSKSSNRTLIMSDQLCGQWYLQACGFGHEVFPESRVKSALEKIFSNNVMKFKKGEQGAVNGFLPSDQVAKITVQCEEVWTGVTYGLAALMIHEGMTEEGFRTAEGVYRTVYEKIGLGFETPEALYEDLIYRSIGYMRPLAIWGMQHAWKARRRSERGSEVEEHK